MLRLIYEPGFSGTHKHGDIPTEHVERHLQSRLCRNVLWFPRKVCPWVTESLTVALELVLFRKPLMVIDFMAIGVYLIDRWFVVTMVGISYQGFWVRLFWVISNGLQVLRLLRPWAVGLRERTCGCFFLWSCGGALLPVAVWLTTETASNIATQADSYPDPEREPLQSQVMSYSHPPGLARPHIRNETDCTRGD